MKRVERRQQVFPSGEKTSRQIKPGRKKEKENDMETVAPTDKNVRDSRWHLFPLKKNFISVYLLVFLLIQEGSISSMSSAQSRKKGTWITIVFCVGKKKNEQTVPDLLTRRSMPLAGDERRLRDSGERDRRRVSVNKR